MCLVHEPGSHHTWHLSGHMERLLVQILLSGNWCPSRLSIRTPLFSLYTRSLGFAITSHGLSFHCYNGDTQLFLSFPPIYPQHPRCTCIFFIPGKDCPRMDVSVTVEDVMVLLSLMARNLGLILGNGLSCTANITAVAWSCRFALCNICRICFFLTEDTTPLLVQVLVMSCHLICNSLLAGLPT